MSRRYTVLITPRAEAELEAAYLWMRENHSPDRAARWREQVLAAAASLTAYPKKGAIARDSPPEAGVRAVHVGPYRLPYVVEGRAVAVVHIRHGARAPGGINVSGWKRGQGGG